MIRQTQGVYDLVEEILKAIAPHDEDTIEKVFVAIENNAYQLDQYRRLENEFSHRVVNQCIGKYAREIAGMKVLRKGVRAARTTLTKTYSKLRD